MLSLAEQLLIIRTPAIKTGWEFHIQDRRTGVIRVRAGRLEKQTERPEALDPVTVTRVQIF